MKIMKRKRIATLNNLSPTKVSSAQHQNQQEEKKLPKLNKKMYDKLEREVIIHSNFQHLRENIIEFSDILKLLKRRKSIAVINQVSDLRKNGEQHTRRHSLPSEIEKQKYSKYLYKKIQLKLKSNKNRDSAKNNNKTFMRINKMNEKQKRNVISVQCDGKKLEKRRTSNRSKFDADWLDEESIINTSKNNFIVNEIKLTNDSRKWVEIYKMKNRGLVKDPNRMKTEFLGRTSILNERCNPISPWQLPFNSIQDEILDMTMDRP